MIVEGIQGVGGINEASAGFLQAISRLVQNNTMPSLLPIASNADMGGAGSSFRQDHAGVDADIYTMAKGMGNGFPVAGIIIAPQLQAKHGMLGTTFGGNHLACAAALAVLEVIEQEQLIANAAETGELPDGRIAEDPAVEAGTGQGADDRVRCAGRPERSAEESVIRSTHIYR